METYKWQTRVSLAQVKLPKDCLVCKCCKNKEHLIDIDKYYNAIVNALRDAAVLCVPRIPTGTLKPYWNEELEHLKADWLFWFHMWVSAGRPSSGWLQHIKNVCKFKYKLALKDAYCEYENKLDDDLLRHFTSIHMPEFWKVWKAKFKRNADHNIHVPGCNNNTDIANAFADKFSAIYYGSQDILSDDSGLLYYSNKNNNTNILQVSDDSVPIFTIEVIETALSRLKHGKACGPDDIASEHLSHAHSILIIHLRLLFYMMVTHGYVPEGFGLGVIVPLIKDKAGNINSLDNYRAISLTPIIAKLFESVVLELCGNALSSDELQFGLNEVMEQRTQFSR